MDHYSAHSEPALAAMMDAEIALRSPVTQAIIDLIMQNDSYVLQQDEARIMQHIAEHGFLAWQDGSKPLMRGAANVLGMVAIGNARAVVEKCLRLGYIKGIVREGHGRLVLTETGWQMLELHELQEEFEDGNDD